MQFPLRRYDGLMQFGVDRHYEGRVFFMQYRQSGRYLIFFSLGLRQKSRVNHGLGIDRFGQFYRPVPRTKRITRVSVFELYRGSDFAGAELVHRDAVSSLQIVNLSDSLESTPRAVE